MIPITRTDRAYIRKWTHRGELMRFTRGEPSWGLSNPAAHSLFLHGTGVNI